MQDTIKDLFIAGSDTTTHSLHWCLHFLACHPEVQEQVRREIAEVVGDGVVKVRHRPRYSSIKLVISIKRNA